jgi:hypothetical protein
MTVLNASPYSLSWGSTAYVKLSATNEIGTTTSDFGGTAVIAKVPDPPTYLASVASATTIDLSWNAPDEDGGFAISDYTLFYTVDGGSEQSISAIRDTSYTITGLSSG